MPDFAGSHPQPDGALTHDPSLEHSCFSGYSAVAKHDQCLLYPGIKQYRSATLFITISTKKRKLHKGIDNRRVTFALLLLLCIPEYSLTTWWSS